MQLGDRSEPQPDFSLLRPRPDFYRNRESHPGPDDILLLVEVADSSLPYDRDRKLPLYARAGVPEVWLVDLETQAVEVHRHPSARGYGETARAARGHSLSVRGLPGVRLDADLILG